MKSIVLKYPVLLFCVLNLLFAVLLGFTFSFDYVPFQWLPGILAIILSIITGGKTGLRSLFNKLAIQKHHGGWYFFSIFYPLIVTFLAFCILSYYLNGCLCYPHLNHSFFDYILLLLFIFWGSTGEELGWRGFMLPLLIKKKSIFHSSLIIGLFWGFWHMYFFSGIGVFIIYMVLTCEFSFVISWLQIKMKGNIIPAIVSHSIFNFCAFLFFEDLFVEGDSFHLLLLYFVIVVLSFIPCFFLINTLKKLN